MKIICIEEHTTDAVIAEAVRPAQAVEAGYLTDAGDVFLGETDAGEDRPLPVSPTVAKDLAADLGAGRIAEMDRHGIDMQVISYSDPTQLLPSDVAVELTRAANDRLADAVRANASRLAGLCALPWCNPAATCAELGRAVETLGLKGALLAGRPGETFLDDPRYVPVLSSLARLGVPLYLHPGPPLPQVQRAYYTQLPDQVAARLSLYGWGWHNEAGVQLVRLILSGAFDRFPDLRVISGHWGEMVPFNLDRLDDTIPRAVSGLSRTLAETFREHVYVTPSGMTYEPHAEFILKVLRPERIIYSVDYPYLTLNGARAFLEKLDVTEDVRTMIAHRNAELLFGI